MSTWTALTAKIGVFVRNITYRIQLSSATYKRFSKFYLPNGQFVDEVLVSRFGIFVITTHAFLGTMHVSDQGKRWALFSKGSRKILKNPAEKPLAVTIELQLLLGLPARRFKPVAVIYASSEKSQNVKVSGEPPVHVIFGGLIPFVKSHKTVILSANQLAVATRILADLPRLPKSPRSAFKKPLLP